MLNTAITAAIEAGEAILKIYSQDYPSFGVKLFGMQDIEIGDPFFDDQFIIKGNDSEKIKRFLADTRIKDLILQQPGFFCLGIRDDEGLFGSDYPEGVDLLYFLCDGVIKETKRLKSVFDFCSVALMRLVEIDSAYQRDPNVKLKSGFF